MKKLILLLSMLVLVLACGGKKTEGSDSKELNIYTWTYFIPQEVIDNFEKETGIKVNLSYYDSNDVMMTKLMSGAKGFDIVSPSTDFVDILIKNGLLEKLDKTKLGKTFENFDEKFGIFLIELMIERLKLREFVNLCLLKQLLILILIIFFLLKIF